MLGSRQDVSHCTTPTHLADELFPTFSLLGAVQAVAGRVWTLVAPRDLQQKQQMSLDVLNPGPVVWWVPWWTSGCSGLLQLTSGSGHGDGLLFLAVEAAAWFSPSCFLFLLRFGFSAF